MSEKDLEKSISEILVKDVMRKELITVDPATTLFQIAKMMEQSGIGAVMIKKNDEPSGIITDRDFAIKVATQSLSLDTPVDKVATYPLQTIGASESIVAAAKSMATKKIRKLAATENGKIIGIITSTDLVNQMATRN